MTQPDNIEALQAEIEKLLAERDSWRRVAERLGGEKQAAEAEATRLTEEILTWWTGSRPLSSTEAEHRENFAVNQSTRAGKRLAGVAAGLSAAIAALIGEKK